MPVSEIRRRILIGQPRFRDFQRPRHFFLPGRGRPPPHSHPDGMSSRVRVQSRVEKIRIVLYPDGECSVKCQWGIRIRLKAFAVTQKQTAAASPTAVTAALQGTPWRGDTPRRGLSASSCSDWDGPHLASLNHGCAKRGVASLLGSGAPVALGCCWTDMTEIRHLAHVMQSLPSMSVVAYQGEMRCHFPSMGARIRDVSHDRSIAMRMKLTARPARAISAGPPLLAPAHNTL